MNNILEYAALVILFLILLISIGTILFAVFNPKEFKELFMRYWDRRKKK